MIIHISYDRFEKILNQGFNLSNEEAVFQKAAVKLSAGTKDRYRSMNHYHVLEGEHGYCKECDGEFDSALVSTPVELENWKLTQQGN